MPQSPPTTASGLTLVGSDTTERTMTSATAGDLVTITGLSIPATTPFMVVVAVRKSAAAFDPSIGITINATVVLEAALSAAIDFPATNEAQDGVVTFMFAPRRTGYDHGVQIVKSLRGASAGSAVVETSGALTAAVPIATVTDVIIRGDSDGTNTLAIHGVYVYTLAV